MKPFDPPAPRVVVLGETEAARELVERLGPELALHERGASKAAAAVADGALVVDAAHPFDAPLRARAPALHAASEGRRLRLSRPPWAPTVGDDWRGACDADDALRALAPGWRTVFVTLGRDRLAPFAADPDTARRYLVRIRRGGRAPWPGAIVAAGSGPFTIEAEAALMRRHGVDALITRNAGGAAAYPKVAAAAVLGLPVVMLDQPPLEPPVVWSVEDARRAVLATLRGGGALGAGVL